MLPWSLPSHQVLAKKMTVLYRLAREQLSKQHHYDFGLRALKSVLVMAGALKRGAPDMSESVVLMRALRDSNLPKFVYDDVPLFLGLVSDLFPGRGLVDAALVPQPEVQQIQSGLTRGCFIAGVALQAIELPAVVSYLCRHGLPKGEIPPVQ